MTSAEMKKCISLYLLTGIIRKPLISQYWSTNPLIRTPFLKTVMPRNRFQSILEFLHFNDNTLYNLNDPDRDRLYKIRPVAKYLVSKFKTVYTPEQHVAIDKELVLWKDRVGVKQYIPSKRARFGIKIFSLCESSGYLWNSFVCIGKDPSADNDELEKELDNGGAVVLKLMQDLFGKGYHLYVSKLFDHLERNGTAACGTARLNRLKVSPSLKKQEMKKGDHAFCRNKNLLMARYKDKKKIYILDTIHEVKTERAPARAQEDLGRSKLSLVNDYNKYMGGADRNDALNGNCTSVRKTYKWTIKVVIYFMEEAVLNTFILYNKQFPGKMRFMNYKMEVTEKSLQVPV